MVFIHAGKKEKLRSVKVIRRLSFEEVHRMLLDSRDTVLLDVREEPEYLSGHAVDAELLPVDEINAETVSDFIAEKDTPVIVYCRTGKRSAEAARILEKLGYRNIYDAGSLVGWPYGLV